MNKICNVLKIQYPLIQGGMLWCSPWQLASAVSNAGGLGVIGAASMYPDVLKIHIDKCKKATDKPFAVNFPLIYPDIEQHMKTVVEMGVEIVFTSAGNPKTWTNYLHDNGIKVIHVVPGLKYAKKAEDAGVDAIVAEGFEAGGHNGREETTTLCLIPNVVNGVDIPVIAAGGIATGKAMLAVMTLGADAVQVGSRFAASLESSSHPNFRNEIVNVKEGDTNIVLKSAVPVRLIKNDLHNRLFEAEKRGANNEELKEILGRAKAKKGMFEGDIKEGELEIGQVAALINEIKPAAQIVNEIIGEYKTALIDLKSDRFKI